MDFDLLPPEINSVRMYAGPGSGPILAASAAWDGLAGELEMALASFSSSVTGLAAQWQGPSSVAMTAAAAPYLQWIGTTATQAEQTAVAAKAAAVAYETAFVATVPPPVIAANRSLLMSLVATNFLGQNTPSIMATEALYLEMWAQDAAAMFGYAGAATTATAALTPFTAPQPNTNPAGLAGEAGAAAQAESSSAASNVQAVLSQLSSAASGPLSTLMPSTTDSASLLSSGASVGMSVGSLLPSLSSVTGVDSGVTALLPGMSGGVGSAAAMLSPTGSAGTAGAGAGGVTASLSRAASLGGLSVPQTWAAGTPTVSPAAAALSGARTAATAPAGPGGMLGGIPLAGTALRGGNGIGMTPRFSFQSEPHPVMPRMAAGG